MTLFLPLSPHETDFTEILRVTLLPPRPLFQNTSNNRIVVPPSDIEPLELNSNTTLLLLQLGNKFDHIVGFIDCGVKDKVHLCPQGYCEFTGLKKLSDGCL